MFPTPIEKYARTTRISYHVALWISLFLWLLPLLAVMLTSLRSLEDISAGNYWTWPTDLWFSNYEIAFNQSAMGRYIINSFIIVIPTVIGAIAVSCLAGYALAHLEFRGQTLLFALFIAGNFIPFQILMIPVRELTEFFGLYDTKLGLILFHVAFQAGFCVLFMRNFIKALPFELIEAARVEGASEYQIFFKIVLPLIRPAVAALAVLIFTFVWNDYFWALVLVQSDSAQPITAGLQSLKGQWVASWHLISAGAILAALPPVAMFFLMQKHFIRGLTMGATKG